VVEFGVRRRCGCGKMRAVEENQAHRDRPPSPARSRRTARRAPGGDESRGGAGRSRKPRGAAPARSEGPGQRGPRRGDPARADDGLRGDSAAADDGLRVGEVLPEEALDELRETARPHAFATAARALADAVVALADEGDPEAAVAAARAAKRAAPRAAGVREALGIALYQVGDFRGARTELAAAQRISGRGDLDAMLADIERGLGRPERAIAIFERSDRSRIEPDAAAELLLVAASAYGDLGQPAAGVALIRRHARWPVELADHHLRLAYAEGDLAEQAGDPTRARAAFARVVEADPDFHDAADRLERLTAR
jgi:tetratricopeptide (TPR) repeat protein